jgi:hypothetical protein
MYRKVLQLVLLLEGCGAHAEVRLRDGTCIEGRIEGSDPEAVHVDHFAVPRDQIAEIDHPGSVALATGASLAVFGLWNVMAPSSWQPESFNCFGEGLGRAGFALVGLAVGAPLAVYGAVVWSGSRGRATHLTALPAPVAGQRGVSLALTHRF